MLQGVGGVDQDVAIGNLAGAASRRPTPSARARGRDGTLDHPGVGPHLEDQIGDVFERDIGGVRARRPAAPAHMAVHPVLRDAVERVVVHLEIGRAMV